MVRRRRRPLPPCGCRRRYFSPSQRPSFAIQMKAMRRRDGEALFAGSWWKRRYAAHALRRGCTSKLPIGKLTAVNVGKAARPYSSPVTDSVAG